MADQSLAGDGNTIAQLTVLVTSLVESQASSNAQIANLTSMVQSMQARMNTPAASETQGSQETNLPDPTLPTDLPEPTMPNNLPEPTAPTTSEAKYHLSTKYPDPEVFSGERDKLDSFLAQLKIKLLVNHDRYPSEPERVAYTISRLGGNALKQITPFIGTGDIASLDKLPTLPTVIEILQRAYGVANRHAEAIRKLRSLKQKNREFITYYAEFERYMADCDYSNQGKTDCLLEGLSEELLTALKSQPNIPSNFQELVALLSRLDAAHRYISGLQSANQASRTAHTQAPAIATG